MTRVRDDDACPGALQLHRAADGALARIRLPGGMIEAAALDQLAVAAQSYGSPAMELTSRGNVQVRAVTDATALVTAITHAGLLPSASHDRVRNVVASPLTGRVGGFGDLRPMVGALDLVMQRTPELAELPGRFWFGLDDGRGDVSGLGTDVGIHLLGPESAAVLVAGADTGVRVSVDDAVDTLAGLARNFLEVRGNAWRTAELDDRSSLLRGLTPTVAPGETWPATTRPPVGWIEQDDGRVALGAGVPLGVLEARAAQFVAALDAPVIVTPWRSLLVCDLDEEIADTALRVLAPLGLIFDERSPWLNVSTCTGSPGCARSLADVRQDAALAVEAGEADDGEHRHLVGCDRACGSPPTGQVLVATDRGYESRRP